MKPTELGPLPDAIALFGERCLLTHAVFMLTPNPSAMQDSVWSIQLSYSQLGGKPYVISAFLHRCLKPTPEHTFDIELILFAATDEEGRTTADFDFESMDEHECSAVLKNMTHHHWVVEDVVPERPFVSWTLLNEYMHKHADRLLALSKEEPAGMLTRAERMRAEKEALSPQPVVTG